MHKKNVIDIRALKTGNRKAYEQVYFEFFDVLFHLSLQYLNNAELAKEVVQDSFMKLWENRNSISDQTNIKNFLYTLTKNSCLNTLRNQKVIADYNDSLRAKELHFQYDALSKLGDEVLIYEELQDKVNTALEKLTPEIRQVFLMNRFEEKKYREIADELNVSQKTVEARMSKALIYLRKELKEFLTVLLL